MSFLDIILIDSANAMLDRNRWNRSLFRVTRPKLPNDDDDGDDHDLVRAFITQLSKSFLDTERRAMLIVYPAVIFVGSPRYKDDECIDKHKKCSEWTDAGYCDIYSNFMFKKCPLSCEACYPSKKLTVPNITYLKTKTQKRSICKHSFPPKL